MVAFLPIPGHRGDCRLGWRAMLERPPGEREWLSWLYVVLWSLFVFAMIPLARGLQAIVANYAGPEIYIYLVIAVVLGTGAAIALHLRYSLRGSIGSYLWLALFAAIFVGYTISLRHSASEALHFVEYGVLGFLLYRALSHRLRDWGIYLAAAILGAIIGTLDEAIQWMTPRRYWALADIRLNVVAVLLVQGAIALGLRPKIIAPGLSAGSLRLACQLGVVALLLLGASALNTPERIAWYSSRVPALAFLQEDEGVMLEYGHLYEDPEVGVFRSRLAPYDLQRSDRERAEEGGRILAQFRDDTRYEEFLEIYTPVSDPFLHEARVHLFRRDRYLERAEEARDDEPTYREHMTIAFRENRLLEKYFPGVLAQSGYAWPAETRARAAQQALANADYESWVSRTLVTAVGEREVVWFFAIAIAGLSLAAWALKPGRRRGRRSVPG